MGTTILILVLKLAATVKGPTTGHPTPGSIHGLAGPQCQTASTGDHHTIFIPTGRPPGQNGSYAEPSLGPPTSCGSTVQDLIPVGNPRSHAQGGPSPHTV